VYSIVVVWCVFYGGGYVFVGRCRTLSMSSASIVLVSISVVCTVWPYACVSAMLIECWMLCGSRRVSAFEFATMHMFRLYFMGSVSIVVCVCVCVGVWQFYECSWCVGCGLSMVCVSSLGVLVLMRLVVCPCVCVCAL
jgi:hypothetical protein